MIRRLGRLFAGVRGCIVPCRMPDDFKPLPGWQVCTDQRRIICQNIDTGMRLDLNEYQRKFGNHHCYSLSRQREIIRKSCPSSKHFANKRTVLEKLKMSGSDLASAVLAIDNIDDLNLFVVPDTSTLIRNCGLAKICVQSGVPLRIPYTTLCELDGLKRNMKKSTKATAANREICDLWRSSKKLVLVESPADSEAEFRATSSTGQTVVLKATLRENDEKIIKCGVMLKEKLLRMGKVKAASGVTIVTEDTNMRGKAIAYKLNFMSCDELISVLERSRKVPGADYNQNSAFQPSVVPFPHLNKRFLESWSKSSVKFSSKVLAASMVVKKAVTQSERFRRLSVSQLHIVANDPESFHVKVAGQEMLLGASNTTQENHLVHSESSCNSLCSTENEPNSDDSDVGLHAESLPDHSDDESNEVYLSEDEFPEEFAIPTPVKKNSPHRASKAFYQAAEAAAVRSEKVIKMDVDEEPHLHAEAAASPGVNLEQTESEKFCVLLNSCVKEALKDIALDLVESDIKKTYLSALANSAHRFINENWQPKDFADYFRSAVALFNCSGPETSELVSYDGVVSEMEKSGENCFVVLLMKRILWLLESEGWTPGFV